MPKCTIDGKEVEFKAGENLIAVAKKVGIDIPVFCYHPGLSVVAQCRMCLVEVEKMPKLQTACSTPATDGMVVKTQSAAVKSARESTMEFLLVNHPLDCPICDKSGECDLQDNSFSHGKSTFRSHEERRTYVDVDMGPVIEKSMNRCIHCTRCIRFGDEIAGIREMVAIQRGNNTDITTIDGLPLQTEYAGNYSDICPTGSLTLKDFRFKKRAWFLKKVPSVCTGCSRGCNTELQYENTTVHRTVPRFNADVNQYWMCDEGRFLFRDTQSKDRVVEPRLGAVPATWDQAVESARQIIATAKSVVVGLGSDLSLEELALGQTFAEELKKAGVAVTLGSLTGAVITTEQDQPLDALLRRADKTGNLKGAENLGLKPISEQQSAKAEVLIAVTGGRVRVPASNGRTVAIGVFRAQDTEKFSVTLPLAAFTEKDGTYVNFQGKAQKARRAVVPAGKSKMLGEVVMVLKNVQIAEKVGA